MTLAQVLESCRRSGATEVYCTRLSPTWLMLHVNLGAAEREALARELRPSHRGNRVTVAEASP